MEGSQPECMQECLGHAGTGMTLNGYSCVMAAMHRQASRLARGDRGGRLGGWRGDGGEGGVADQGVEGGDVGLLE